MKAREPLPLLTSLRFFAAAQVVFYHQLLLPGAPRFIRDLNSCGDAAVTFFFILSGFILTYVYAEPGKINVRTSDFWKARAARIVPGYFFGMVLALPHWTYTAFVSHLISIYQFTVGLVLVTVFQQAWWPAFAMSVNFPAWSLSVEFFFYLLFPLLIWLMSKRLAASAVMAFSFVVFVAVARSLVSAADAPFESPEKNFHDFFPLFHIPQFIFGVALGRLFLFGPKRSTQKHAAMFCIGAICTLALFASRSRVPFYSEPVLAILFALVIFGGAGWTPRALICRPLLLLGEASYAIYITHAPIGWWWGWLTKNTTMPYALNFAAYFLVLLAITLSFTFYVETPIRRWMLGHPQHRPD